MSPSVQDDHWLEDRRSGHRYPIHVELFFLVRRGETIEAAGNGKTVNISRSGILFQSMHSVLPGAQIEVSIAWPIRIDGIAHMQLRVSGRTVRTQDNCTGIHILRYEFRTGRIHVPSVPPTQRRSRIRDVWNDGT
jgi:hypothetical protein